MFSVCYGFFCSTFGKFDNTYFKTNGVMLSLDFIQAKSDYEVR